MKLYIIWFSSSFAIISTILRLVDSLGKGCPISIYRCRIAGWRNFLRGILAPKNVLTTVSLKFGMFGVDINDCRLLVRIVSLAWCTLPFGCWSTWKRLSCLTTFSHILQNNSSVGVDINSLWNSRINAFTLVLPDAACFGIFWNAITKKVLINKTEYKVRWLQIILWRIAYAVVNANNAWQTMQTMRYSSINLVPDNFGLVFWELCVHKL